MRNAHWPLRLRQMGIAFAAAAGLVLASAAGPAGGPVRTVAEAQAQGCPGARAAPGSVRPVMVERATICLLNQRRAHRGVPRLAFRKPLRRAAKRHSTRMRNWPCFSHFCGGDLERRVRHSAYLPCNCSFGLGETLAWGAYARARAIQIVRGWMRSPPHRRVLMSRSFRHIGVGVVWGSPYRPGNRRHATYTAILGFKR